MKYTNYIINGNIIHIDEMISDNKALRPITIMAALPVAILGVPILASSIPMALFADGTRYVRYRYYQYMKNYRRFRYYDSVFTSLGYRDKQKSKMQLAFDALPYNRIKSTPRYMLKKNSYQLVYIRENIQEYIKQNLVNKLFK